MKTERIGYMDALRGLAIFLMVMGHVLAWLYIDSKQAFATNLYSGLLWEFIYSFHMPLFMFVSGYFLVIKFNDNLLKESAKFVYKKSIALLLPFITMGFLLWAVRDNGVEYWFLRTLFELFIVCLPLYLLSSFIANKLRNIRKDYYLLLIDLIIFALGFVIIIVIGKLLNSTLEAIFDTTKIVRLYPFFISGLLLRRHKLLQKIVSQNIIYSLSLITFVASFFIRFFDYYHIPVFIINFSAIFALRYFFENSLNNESRGFKLFSLFGKHSIGIYLIHFFFSFRLTELGDYLLKVDFYGTSLLIQIVYSIVVSFIIVGLCLGISKILSTGKILNLLLLGKQNYIK